MICRLLLFKLVRYLLTHSFIYSLTHSSIHSFTYSLTHSFTYTGNDRGAMVWLQELDDGLMKKGAKYDIVDVLTAEELGKYDFASIIAKSVSD